MKIAHSKPTEKTLKEHGRIGKSEMHFKLELRGEDGHLDYNGSLNEISGRIASMMLQVSDFAAILLKATDLFLHKVEQNKSK